MYLGIVTSQARLDSETAENMPFISPLLYPFLHTRSPYQKNLWLAVCPVLCLRLNLLETKIRAAAQTYCGPITRIKFAFLLTRHFFQKLLAAGRSVPPHSGMRRGQRHRFSQRRIPASENSLRHVILDLDPIPPDPDTHNLRPFLRTAKAPRRRIDELFCPPAFKSFEAPHLKFGCRTSRDRRPDELHIFPVSRVQGLQVSA
ncbi:hypothetical protein B0H11DRAFT_1925918 [Mycena galericulata]|nr:hypothetical protein B0H11DRAFT_1925918 [Mycena galericulata]